MFNLQIITTMDIRYSSDKEASRFLQDQMSVDGGVLKLGPHYKLPTVECLGNHLGYFPRFSMDRFLPMTDFKNFRNYVLDLSQKEKYSGTRTRLFCLSNCHDGEQLLPKFSFEVLALLERPPETQFLGGRYVTSRDNTRHPTLMVCEVQRMEAAKLPQAYNRFIRKYKDELMSEELFVKIQHSEEYIEIVGNYFVYLCIEYWNLFLDLKVGKHLARVQEIQEKFFVKKGVSLLSQDF